jgi:hypothetical protein
MATAEQIQGWLAKNQDKAGTPDFVTMTEALNKLSGSKAAPAETAPAETAYTDLGVPIGQGTGAGAGGDPSGAFSTTGRVLSSAATGVPDVLTAIGNAGVRASQSMPPWLGMAGVQPGTAQEAPYPGQLLNQTMGVPELPKDASLTRQLLEGGASTLLGGGASSILRAGSLPAAAWAATTRTVAPTVASHFGGDAGARVASALNLDPQTGALIGSLLGGSISGAPDTYNRWSHNWYADRAKPNVAEIDAAMKRMGGQATPGMLGNNIVQGIERQIGASVGGKEAFNTGRQGAADTINTALNTLADARGQGGTTPLGTGPGHNITEGTIGSRLAEAVRQEADTRLAQSEDAQRRLKERVGADTPVLVRPVLERGEQLTTQPAEGADQLSREAVRYRTGTQLEPLMLRDPLSRQPIMSTPSVPTPANRGAYVDQGSEQVPYGPFMGWRSRLGKAIDNAAGGEMPAVPQLYPPATEAARVAAEGRDVPRQDFQNTMARSEATLNEPVRPGEQPGDYPALMNIATKEPSAAYDWLRGGLQNPDRLALLEATQHPAVSGIMGDLIKRIGLDTIGNPNEGAAGPRQLATQLEGINPESRSILFGNQQAAANDVTTGARAYNYPTSQTGLNQATSGAGDRTVAAVMLSNALDKLGGTAGAVLSLGAMPLLNRLRSAGLNSPATLNAMRGGPAPSQNMSDLIAGINAAAAAQAQR